MTPSKGESLMANRFYEVWHLKAEISSESEERGIVEYPTDYELVARVKARSLDEVYEKTNGMDGPWWEKEGVERLKRSRSTSIDDVVIGPALDIQILGPKGWIQALGPHPLLQAPLEVEPKIEPSR
jgi:hypothetical protein